jgi:uncharacterized protein (DUF3084 family)
MDGLTIGFILLIVLLGGASAFVADILGYKIGKKRLSLWHLRPKYVARLSVTLAGMLIPLFTVAVLYGASSEFRMWLNKGRQAVRELQQKEEELNKVSKEVIKRETENAKLDNRNRIISAELRNNQKQSDRQKRELQQFESQLRQQQTAASRLGNLVTAAQNRIRDLNLKDAQTQKQLGVSKKLLEQEKLALGNVRKDLATTIESRNIAVNEAKKAIEDFNEISEKNTNLTNILKDLQGNLADLRGQIDSLMVARDSSKAQAENAQKELDTLRAGIDDYVRQQQEIQSTLRRVGEQYAVFSRQNAVTFLRGEELTRSIVPGNLSEPEAKSLFYGLLRQSKIVAADRGAKPDSNYQFDGAAGIVAFTPEGREISLAEIEKYWIQQIISSKENRVLVVRSLTNRFASEPVTLDLQFYPNPIVFREGEIIAEGRVDGRKSDAEVFGQIREFVRTYVNAKARRVKMIPVRNKDGELFGELTANQILETVSLIQSAPRILRLQARATTDIRAGDPLTFELVIK